MPDEVLVLRFAWSYIEKETNYITGFGNHQIGFGRTFPYIIRIVLNPRISNSSGNGSACNNGLSSIKIEGSLENLRSMTSHSSATRIKGQQLLSSNLCIVSKQQQQRQMYALVEQSHLLCLHIIRGTQPSFPTILECFSIPFWEFSVNPAI